jgi:isocitrate dehydrogenase
MQASTVPPVPVTVAHGDGIGPEIMDATLRVLEAAGARLAPETIEVGKAVYERGFSSGIEPSAWESLQRTRVLLKGPITTPQGGGYKSLNVTIRKTMGLYANVRPCVSYAPFVDTKFPQMDLVIVRENEEDLYAGIEHRQTDDVYQCLKLITRPGSEKIVRYAFEYAVAHGRRKVTCMTKDNIMKMTDGLFHRTFERIAGDYPGIETDHWIVDIGAARLATRPELFDVVVMPNLYGDILSDVAAELTGSVGLGGSANIGEQVAMFEAIHGSAPKRAGQGVANPSGLMLAGIMMLVHIGQPEAATRLHNAWLRTLEDGVHTRDLHGPDTRQPVSTEAFATAVIERLGAEPARLKPVRYAAGGAARRTGFEPTRPARKGLVGVDIFLHWRGGDANTLASLLKATETGALRLEMITNRGVKVWPGGMPETFCVDHWRCRYIDADGDGAVTHAQILEAMARVSGAGLDFIKTENLCTFDGEPGYSLGQGQ